MRRHGCCWCAPIVGPDRFGPRARKVCWVQRLLRRRWPSGGKLAGRARAWSWRLSGLLSSAFPPLLLKVVMSDQVIRVGECVIVIVVH